MRLLCCSIARDASGAARSSVPTFVGLIILVLAIVAGGIYLLFEDKHTQLKSLENEFREAGIPLTWEWERPPDFFGKRAQQYVLPLPHATDLVKNLDDVTTEKIDEVSDYFVGDPLEMPQEISEEANHIVTECDEILALLIEASESGPTLFLVDYSLGPSNFSSHYWYLWDCIRLLSIDTGLAIREKDWERYESNVDAMFNIVHSVEMEPIEESQMIRLSYLNCVVGNFAWSCSQRPLPLRYLDSMARDLEREEAHDAMRLGVGTDFGVAYSQFEDSFPSLRSYNERIALLNSMHFLTLNKDTPWPEILAKMDADRVALQPVEPFWDGYVEWLLQGNISEYVRGDATLRIGGPSLRLSGTAFKITTNFPTN